MVGLPVVPLQTFHNLFDCFSKGPLRRQMRQCDTHQSQHLCENGMSIFTQIFVGSVFLGICSIAHVVILILATKMTKELAGRLTSHHSAVQWGILIVTAVAAVVLSHTIQVWIWALALLAFGALTTLSEAIYFSLATYTTLGYGDVIVGPEHRIFASMGAVTGMLSFGLSTAFLVGLFSRMIEDE